MSKTQIRHNIDIFICPICRADMGIQELKSLVCENGHCFDLSKKGYVNMLSGPVASKYNRELFDSRNIINKIGFFDPMIEGIGRLIHKFRGNTGTNKVKILDMGCGEGSNLARLINMLNRDNPFDYLGVGVDISKEGIKMASGNYPDIIWCVADLTKTPFADKQFNIILNIFTPSNYAEFKRIIADDGLVIKVVPGNGYLSELRRLFYDKTGKQTYSNEPVIKLFGNNFNPLETQQLQYKVKIDNENMRHLIKMTPLSWGATDIGIQKAIDRGIDSITVDVTIMLGKK
ncbi:MAG: putative RNA methyltransferase [Bacillota bacterium]